MTDKISSEDFAKAFGGGIKHNLKRPQVEKEPVFKSVPTYRNYEDYHDAEQYTQGWNDAMRFIFGIEEK